jgi:hypothetical protein
MVTSESSCRINLPMSKTAKNVPRELGGQVREMNANMELFESIHRGIKELH